MHPAREPARIPREMMLANQDSSSEPRLRSGMMMLDKGMEAPPNILTRLTIKEQQTCLAVEVSISSCWSAVGK